MIGPLVRQTRSVRRFAGDREIGEDVLRELVDLARLGGSARNGQPLRYMPVTDKAVRDRVFPHLGWAGYLTGWPGPVENERPAAYILCLLARDWLLGPEYEAYFDLGVSTQNMLLGAAEKGISGCRIGSVSQNLARDLNVDGRHKLMLVLALGYPAEQVALETVGPDADIRYWRDEAGVHHVPKRSLEDVLYRPEAA